MHYNDLQEGDFQIARAGWIADYDDPQNFLYLLETKTGPMNYGNFSNADFDGLWNRLRRPRIWTSAPACWPRPNALRWTPRRTFRSTTTSRRTWCRIGFRVGDNAKDIHRIRAVAERPDAAATGTSFRLTRLFLLLYCRSKERGDAVIRAPSPAWRDRRCSSSSRCVFMMRGAPGGPFDLERALPPQIEKNLLAAYNLDQPLWMQYLHYLGDAIQGDFGPSFKYQDFTVTELIMIGFPASLKVGGTAIVLAVLIGTFCGTMAALRQRLVDRLYGDGRRHDRHRDPQFRDGAPADADPRRLSRHAAGGRRRRHPAHRPSGDRAGLPQVAYIRA